MLDLCFEFRKVVPRIRGSTIERRVLAAVDRFLRGEALDLLRQLRRRAIAERADALDEKGLADRERRRQRVVDGGGLHASAVPQASAEFAAFELPIARRDRQVRRSGQSRGAHEWKL